jgi:hypothetical protein
LANGFMQVNLNYTSTGSTPDSLAFYYNGVRTSYHNERGELRVRPAADNSVPFRVQQRGARQLQQHLAPGRPGVPDVLIRLKNLAYSGRI